VTAGGLAFAALGFVLLTRAGAESGLPAIVAGSAVFSLGLAPVITLANDIIIGTAPPERAGAAAGISETTAELGGALGIAILGSVGTFVYRRGMTQSPVAGVPADAWEAARGTLGGAAAAARNLPDPIGPALLEASREAFTRGFRLTSWINAVVTAALAVLAAFLLRREKAEPRAGADLHAASAAP
jgi:DHA2 family multidrug resistance protein-like MFS transporter